MTLRIYHYIPEEDELQVLREEKLTSIGYVDQRENGIWLFVTKINGQQLALEFDPKLDHFIIFEN